MIVLVAGLFFLVITPLVLQGVVAWVEPYRYADAHELAAADLELDLVRVDPRQVGADDRPRRVARVVDVDPR